MRARDWDILRLYNKIIKNKREGPLLFVISSLLYSRYAVHHMFCVKIAFLQQIKSIP
jgi:hypothetical protein